MELGCDGCCWPARSLGRRTRRGWRPRCARGRGGLGGPPWQGGFHAGCTRRPRRRSRAARTSPSPGASDDPVDPSPTEPNTQPTPWAARSSSESSERRGRPVRVGAELDGRLADRAELGLEPARPLLAETGEVAVVAGSRQLGQLAEKRRQVLDVEHGEADHQPGVASAVGQRGAQVGDPRADALRRRAPVQAVGRGARPQRLEQPLGLAHPAVQGLPDRRALQGRGQPAPAADQLPAGGVELAVGAVLGGVEVRLSVSAIRPAQAARRSRARARSPTSRAIASSRSSPLPEGWRTDAVSASRSAPAATRGTRPWSFITRAFEPITARPRSRRGRPSPPGRPPRAPPRARERRP